SALTLPIEEKSSIISEDGNPARANVKQDLGRRSYALSWKPCQEDSLNLPDHMYSIYTMKRYNVGVAASFQLSRIHIPHAYTEAFKVNQECIKFEHLTLFIISCIRISCLVIGFVNVDKTPQQGPTQSWLMSLAATADKPSKTFNELMSTPIDFSAYNINDMNITNLTQETLLGLAFKLLKGTHTNLLSWNMTLKNVTKLYQRNLIGTTQKVVISMVAAIGSRQVKIRSHMLILDRQKERHHESSNTCFKTFATLIPPLTYAEGSSREINYVNFDGIKELLFDLDVEGMLNAGYDNGNQIDLYVEHYDYDVMSFIDLEPSLEHGLEDSDDY
nr:hypothetical protein [Tanacetum cinerariifolium]